METTTTTISVRLRPEVATALEYLQKDGVSRSDAVQAAVMDAAKARRNEALLAESTALLNDPEDVAEMKRVSEFLDSLD